MYGPPGFLCYLLSYLFSRGLSKGKMTLSEQLRRLELRLLEPEVRRDGRAIEEMLTEDFCEIGSSGRLFDRDAIVRELAKEPITIEFEASDFSVHEISSEVMQVLYMTTRRDERGEVIVRARRSSIWVKRDGKWSLKFHQGTKIA